VTSKRPSSKRKGRVCSLAASSKKHGPHLPLGTDLLNARYVSEHAAQEESAIIFPEYFAGQIFEAKHEPGTIAYSPELQLRLLQETTDEMARNGCKKVVIVNAHGGNESTFSGDTSPERKRGPRRAVQTCTPARRRPPELWSPARTFYTWIARQANQVQSKSALNSRRVCSRGSGGTQDFLTTILATARSPRKSWERRT